MVTGGATGIGTGIARRLLDDGARVLIAALTEGELKRTLEEFRAAGHDPAGFAGDLSRPGQADMLLDAAISAFGGTDILVNNAGGGVIKPTLEHTEETLRATIRPASSATCRGRGRQTCCSTPRSARSVGWISW